MSQRDTQGQGAAAVREDLPTRPESPEPRWGTLLAVLLLAALLPGAAAAQTSRAPNVRTSGAVTLNTPAAARDALRAVFARATAKGHGTAATARVLRPLGAAIDSQLAQLGSVSVDVRLLTDAVDAVQQAKWSHEHASRFLIALHRESSEGRGDAEGRVRTAIDQVRHGQAAAAILGPGETLRSAVASR